MESLYCIEYSQLAEENGGLAFYLNDLKSAIQSNLLDCVYHYRKDKLQIVFIGSLDACQKQMDILLAFKCRRPRPCGKTISPRSC
jgi:hypothetical protein